MLTKLLSFPVPGSRKMEYKGNSWHETCFLCHRCQQPIGTKSFIPKDTGYFCVPCFEKQFAYQCCACKKVELQLSVLFVLTAAVNLPDSGNWMLLTMCLPNKKLRSKTKMSLCFTLTLSGCVLPPGHHNRWSDLPRQALAPRVFPMHRLQKAAVGSALHLQGKLPLLPRMLQQPVCKEVRGLHQVHHQWVTGYARVFFHSSKAFICICVGTVR